MTLCIFTTFKRLAIVNNFIETLPLIWQYKHLLTFFVSSKLSAIIIVSYYVRSVYIHYYCIARLIERVG